MTIVNIYLWVVIKSKIYKEEHKMKKFDLCVKLVVEDVKSDLTGYYKDAEIETWADYAMEALKQYTQHM